MNDAVRCLRILVAGAEPRPKPWTKQMRRLPYHLLVVNAEGVEQLRFGDHVERIGNGQVYLVPAGTPFSITCEWGNHPCFVHFDMTHDAASKLRQEWLWVDDPLGSRMPPPALHPGLVLGATFDLRPPKAVEAECARRLRHLVHRWLGGDALDVAEAENALEALLLLWARSVGPQPDADAQHLQRIGRAEALARESIDQSFGVRAFAAAAGLHRSYFHNLYRRLRGEAPSEYLTRLRMQRAQALLAEGSEVAAVAAACGYTDRSAFSRAFRTQVGVGPAEWKRQSTQNSTDGGRDRR